MAAAFAATTSTSYSAFTATSFADPTAPSRARGIRLSLHAAPAPRRPVVSAVSAPRSSPAASSLERLHFVKYQGLGNDFIMVDNRDSSVPMVTPKQAAMLCDRNFGIGADGVIFVMPAVNGAGYTMRMFNSDGSEPELPEMCGNGVRCFVRFIDELENLQGTNSSKMHTGTGLIIPEIQNDGQVLQVDDLELTEIGPKFEHHEMFPARTNTEFVEVLSRSHLKMRVWERGAGATLACGTGACAVVVAAVLEGRAERKCIVDVPGGSLEIEWSEDGNHVYMTAPAEAVMAQQGESACPPGRGDYAFLHKAEKIHCREAARDDSNCPPVWLEVLELIASPNLIVPLAVIKMVATALSRGWIKIEPISSNLIVVLAVIPMLVMAVSRGWVKIEPINVTEILKYYNGGGRHE